MGLNFPGSTLLNVGTVYLARGGQDGDEVSDWLAAERQLKASNQPQGKKAKAAAISL